MKILLATGMYPPDIGGPATYAKLLADELPKQGITVDVQNFGSVRRLPKLVRHVVFAAKIIWHARSSDVVFAQDTVSAGLPALVAALVLGKPFLLRVPGDHAWEQASQRYGVTDPIYDFQHKKYCLRVELIRRIQKFVVSQADSVMAPSEYFAGIVRGWVTDGQKVKAVYNGIDVAAIEAIGTGVTFKPKKIITAGRLVPWKGFDALIKMMKELPGYRLEIAGDGPERKKLEALIASEGVGSQVEMLGQLDRQALLRRIAESECFVLNSGFESFSYQAVEVMAVGTSLIVSDAGSLGEITGGGVSGRLVAPDDRAGIVKAVKELSSDPLLRARLSAAGKVQAAKFSIEATLAAVEGELESIHNHRSPSRSRRTSAAKILRYLFSGGTAAATDLGLLYVFTDVFGMWYLLSSVIAFIFAFMVSFTLQKFFTFQDHGVDGVRSQALAYLGVTSTNLALNTGLIYLFVQYTGLHYLSAQVITSIFIAIESFVVYSMFIFKDKTKTKVS